MKILNSYLEEKHNVRDPIETIDKHLLNELLADFLVNVRQKDGKEYEPSTLRGFFASISRYLASCHYYDNDDQTIVTDPVFIKTRKALTAKQKQLKGQGKGARPRRARAFTQEEVDRLFNDEVFTLKKPEVLQ